MQCVVSTFVRKTCTLKYNLRSRGLLYSQEQWQAISKGFVWIQTFHLGDSRWLEIVLVKAQFVTVVLLTEWSFIIGTVIINKHVFYCIPVVSPVCTRSAYRYRPVGLQQHNFWWAHLWCFSQRKLLVTFNHGCGLLAGGLSVLHYEAILLQRMHSSATEDQVAHITCRPLINQTRALSPCGLQLCKPPSVRGRKISRQDQWRLCFNTSAYKTSSDAVTIS